MLHDTVVIRQQLCGALLIALVAEMGTARVLALVDASGMSSAAFIRSTASCAPSNVWCVSFRHFSDSCPICMNEVGFM